MVVTCRLLWQGVKRRLRHCQVHIHLCQKMSYCPVRGLLTSAHNRTTAQAYLSLHTSL